MNKKIVLSIILLSSVALFGCTNSVTPYNPHPVLPMANVVTVSHAIVMHPAQKNAVTAIYLDITDNSHAQDAILIAATTEIATEVQLHKLVNGDMVQVTNGIDIASNSTDKLEGQLSVATGGYHIMLIELKQALHKGQIIPVKLLFQDGSSKLIRVLVK